MSNKYHYFYKITNNINGHYYYGVHNTDDLDDGYMGSGLKLQDAFNKYGIENFSKEIIKMFDTDKEAFEYESQIVTEDLVNSKECYNIAPGGQGGHLSDNTVAVIDKDGNRFGVNSSDPRLLSGEVVSVISGTVRTDENKEKVSKGVLKYYVTEEGKQRKEEIKKDRRQYWDSEEGLEMRKKLSEMKKEYYQSEIGKETIKRNIEKRKDKPVTQEHRDKQSKSITKFWNSDAGIELRNKWKKTMTGTGHNSYGRGRRYDVIDIETGEIVLENACSYDVQVFWPKKVDPSWYYNHDKLYLNRYKFTLSKG